MTLEQNFAVPSSFPGWFTALPWISFSEDLASLSSCNWYRIYPGNYAPGTYPVTHLPLQCKHQTGVYAVNYLLPFKLRVSYELLYQVQANHHFCWALIIRYLRKPLPALVDTIIGGVSEFLKFRGDLPKRGGIEDFENSGGRCTKGGTKKIQGGGSDPGWSYGSCNNRSTVYSLKPQLCNALRNALRDHKNAIVDLNCTTFWGLMSN